MTKYALMLAAAGLIALTPAVVKAEEHAADAHAHATDAAAHEEHELEDGTKVSVEGDHVYVVAADGAKSAAPDGEHKAKDGTVLHVKDGKLVK